MTGLVFRKLSYCPHRKEIEYQSGRVGLGPFRVQMVNGYNFKSKKAASYWSLSTAWGKSAKSMQEKLLVRIISIIE